MTVKTRDFAGFYAPEKLGKTRKITPEGFLILEGTPIARTGEQLYNGREINGELSPDDEGYVAPSGSGLLVVERLPDEVFRAETLASFEGKDFVIEHPPDGVDVQNWKNHTVGHVQNVRRGSGIEDDLVVADIVVKDPLAIEYINKQLPEISAGYNALYEPVSPGRAVQRNIVGNHVAAVRAGRAGARVAVRDHSINVTEDFDMAKSFLPALRAALVAVGIKTEDAATVVKAVETSDAAAEEGETNSELKKMSSDMKGIKDWMAARDAEREEEKKEGEAKVAKDAEEAKKKEEEGKKGEKESEEAEKTGDTVLEAESPGHVVNLGKTWKGSMTGDAAATEPVLQAVVARAEILAPGIAKPTADALKGNKGTALATFMRSALKQHASTADGAANINPFAMGMAIESLKGERLVGAFNGAAQLARAHNNQRSTSLQSRKTGDFSASTSIAEINKRNREHWAKRNA